MLMMTATNGVDRAAAVGCRVLRAGRLPSRAFTLVEVVVVIGIIVLLTGLTLTAATSVTRHMEVRRTTTTLELLDMAMAEWEANAGRKLTWKAVHDPEHIVAEVHSDTPEVLIISEVLDAVRRDHAARSILAQIEPEFLLTFTADDLPRWVSPDEYDDIQAGFLGSLTVVDAWGGPIYATHPGRAREPMTFTYDSSRLFDADGTIRTYNESKYGIAAHRRVCFVSAGPDGDFGFVGSPVGTPDFEATLDNLYSYPPLLP
jgi:hypothetical protein